MRESLLKLLWRRRWVACWKTSLSKRPDVPDASKHHHHSFAAVASPAVAVRRSSPCMTSSKDIARLLEIMAALRDKETGCPWDVEQDFESIAPYTIEEAYEVKDAIERNDMHDLCEELGDLLLQVVFHSRIAEEAGS